MTAVDPEFLERCIANDSSYDRESETDAVTPASIVAHWRTEPPALRVSTGISALDALCGGGLTLPRRVYIVGAPGAGKTAMSAFVADTMDRSGLYIGWLGIDEEPDDVALRFAQMAGCDRAKLQARDPDELARASEACGAMRIHFYDFEWTIEDAATDLASWAEAAGARAVLVIDSIQTASCRRLQNRDSSPREVVEANVAAFRKVTTAHRLLGIATSEANRAAYRDKSAPTSAMAAGAESRSIEFSAQTLIVLTPDGDGVLHADVAKNRAARCGEFLFRLHEAAHEIIPVNAQELARDRARRDAAERDQRADARAAGDAVHVARVLARSAGLGVNGLLQALRDALGTFDEKRLAPALQALGDGVVKRDGPNKSKRHYLDGAHLPSDVVTAVPEAGAVRPPVDGAAGTTAPEST